MARRRQRLDQPLLPRRALRRPSVDADAFGRFSEKVARTFGTARFLVIQTAIVVAWIAYNGWTSYNFYVKHNGPAPWDRYPFILLNLAFSTQAAYAAPFILLATNRQDARDRISVEEDRQQSARSVADTEYLAREVAALRIAMGEVATRDFVRGELQRLLAEIRDSDPARPDNP